MLPVHKYIINAMQFQSLDDHTLYTASSDGTLRVTDLETQVSKQLLDLNPNGYVSDAMWRMLTSLEHVPACGAVLAGDDVGQVFMLDPRDSHAVRHRVQMHRKDKVRGAGGRPLRAAWLTRRAADHQPACAPAAAAPHAVGRYGPHDAAVGPTEAGGGRNAGHRAAPAHGDGRLLFSGTAAAGAARQAPQQHAPTDAALRMRDCSSRATRS